MKKLSWVAVDDEFGRDPALRWLNTNTLIFPKTAISKRVEDAMEIEIYEMFGGFQKAIHSALEKQAQQTVKHRSASIHWTMFKLCRLGEIV